MSDDTITADCEVKAFFKVAHFFSGSQFFRRRMAATYESGHYGKSELSNGRGQAGDWRLGEVHGREAEVKIDKEQEVALLWL